MFLQCKARKDKKMSKTCNNCGNIMDDSSNICPRCGTQYVAIQPPPPERSANSSYQPVQPQYQQQQQPQQMPYQQPQYQQPAEQPMTLGSWVGTVLLTNLLGIISLVLLFVWAFATDVPTAKKNYCRAMLILHAIMLGLSILMIILFVVIVFSTGIWDQIIDELSELENYIDGYNF